MRCRVIVPASTSNLGPGFDCLGLALEPTLRVDLTTSDSSESHIEVDGPETRGLPDDETNLTLVALRDTITRTGQAQPSARLRIYNEIPIARGLGSSGAAITAGIVLGHLLAEDDEPTQAKILEDAVRIEGHPDNVAPQILGGFIAAASDGDAIHTARLPIPSQFEILLVIPEYEVPTREARRILPDPVPLTDAVFNLSHVALLCGALQSNDDELLRVAMRDRLHERHRVALVPGLPQALDSLRADPHCIAAALSGSGPTLLAFYRDVPAQAGTAALAALAQHDVMARVQHVRPRASGVEWKRQRA